MKYILLALVFLLGTRYGYGQQGGWFLYEDSSDGDFSVEVPGQMDVRSKVMETSLGELTSVAYTLEGMDEDKNRLYLITKVSYPDGTFPADSVSLIDMYLEEAVYSTAENVGGEVVYASKSDRTGPETFLFRIKYNEGVAVIKGKAIIKDDTFYLLQVYCHTDDSLNREMDYFLDSFSLR